MNDLKTKRCPRCGITKTHDQFLARVRADGVQSGLRAYCIPCEADYKRARQPAAMTQARYARIRAMRADGLMVSEIADRLKLPVSRVQQAVERLPRRLRYASADTVM